MTPSLSMQAYEEVGKLMDDKSEQVKGKLEQAKGEVKKDLGKASQ